MRNIFAFLSAFAATFSVSVFAQDQQFREASVACEGCPDFVQVPEPPETLRRISHVASVELTWKQYLAAYDDEACPIPRSDFGLNGSEGKRELDKYVDFLRVDWPATRLGPAEVECYANWLSERIGREVVVPTAEEWLWFARSGEEGINFPWGNNPSERRAAIGGYYNVGDHEMLVPYASGPLAPVNQYMGGVKVAQFPPTSWGLYDVFGNAWELTSDISNRSPPPGTSQPDYLKRAKRVRILGQNAWVEDWQETSLEGQPNYALVTNNRYSADVAVRFVLLD